MRWQKCQKLLRRAISKALQNIYSMLDAQESNKKRMAFKNENMVFIEGGAFLMGSDNFYPEEKPAHKVTVDGFWIDKYPVTNKAYSDFVIRIRGYHFKFVLGLDYSPCLFHIRSTGCCSEVCRDLQRVPSHSETKHVHYS